MFIKIFKKNQIIFMTVGLMLIVAGYLNYTYNPESRYKTELTGNIDDTLGDTIYVNAFPSDNTETVINNDNSSEINQVDSYFIELKQKRDKMYDEQLDLYKEMLENTNISTEQKDNAQEEIKEINKLKNSIMIAENLILLKNIEDVAIVTSGENINVVIKSENELDKEKVAQIYSIIEKELEADIEDIQIMLRK